MNSGGIGKRYARSPPHFWAIALYSILLITALLSSLLSSLAVIRSLRHDGTWAFLGEIDSYG